VGRPLSSVKREGKDDKYVVEHVQVELQKDFPWNNRIAAEIIWFSRGCSFARA